MHDALPSPWVRRFSSLIAARGRVLDVASGAGRHARLLATLNYAVEAVDRDANALAALASLPGITTRLADLEGEAWPYPSASFDGVIVTNYLHRPRFAELLDVLKPGGVLIYETFMVGNEAFGKPSNPTFLLRPGELLERVGPNMSVVAFEQGRVSEPRPAAIQRICAVVGDVGVLPCSRALQIPG